MKDKQSRLDQLLRALPREQASDGFRDRVLRAARQAERPRAARAPWFSRPRYALALTAGVLSLALGLSMSLYLDERGRQAELRREIAELRKEHRRLDAEVEQLRGETIQAGGGAGARRVIYLGGDDTVDYVLDLERLARQGSLGGRLIPAAYPAAPYSGGAL